MDKFPFLYDKKPKEEKEFAQEYLYIEDYFPEVIKKEPIEEKKESIIIIDLFDDNEE